MFDLCAIQAAIAAHGPVVRVVIAGFEGSSPREVGAAMLVWPGGQEGTIGGGALEWEALARARGMGISSPRMTEKYALGPSLGQCCGGAVTLWFERFEVVPAVQDGVFARGPGEMPLAVKRLMARARGQGVVPALGLVQGWFVEPVAQPSRHVWVWGAGHVGRAVVQVLAPLPGVAITWVDVDMARFPDAVPDGVRMIARADAVESVAEAPVEAEHLVMTFSHALDLELCHRLLGHGFARLGLIGSATKWARFRSRLAALGQSPAQIARIDCPIGDPALGKHPQAIAIGVAAGFLAPRATKDMAAHG
jgi:xanthine dehydrogenase accessory factor